MYIHIYTLLHVRHDSFTYMSWLFCTRVLVYVHIYIDTYTIIHTYIYIHIYVYTHIYSFACAAWLFRTCVMTLLHACRDVQIMGVGHDSHVNATWHTCEWVTTHMTRMQKSIYVCIYIYIYIWLYIYIYKTHMNESRHTWRACHGIRGCESWHTFTYASVWHDSITITHSHMRHDSFTRVPWLILICVMTHAHVWHDSFIRGTWLTNTCAMTHSHV